MHELGIVFHIIDALDTVAKENDLSAIQSVTIQLGEVSTVIAEYLVDCWNWAVKKRPLLKECRMEVETLPAVCARLGGANIKDLTGGAHR